MPAFLPDKKIRSVLAVSPNWLGDAVLSIPTLYGLRSLFPEARLCVLAANTVIDVFRGVCCVDERIPFCRSHGLRRIGSLYAVSTMVRRKSFDAAVIMTRSAASALICLGAGIPQRIGIGGIAQRLLLSREAGLPALSDGVHQADRYKRLLEPIGIASFPDRPRLAVPDDERTWASRLDLPEGRFLAAISPGAAYGSAKQWLPGRFAELARRLAGRHGCGVIVVGDKKSSDAARDIMRAAPGRVVDLCGRTTVLQLAALLERCSVLVTNDSGPMHLAAALSCPVVAIFGSTDPRITGPCAQNARVVSARVPCSPCLKRQCPQGHLACMGAVSVEAVEAAVAEVMIECSDAVSHGA